MNTSRTRRWRAAGIALALCALVAVAQAQVPIPVASAQELRLNRWVDGYWLAARLVQLGLPLVLLCSGYGARLCRHLARWVRGSRVLTVGLFGSAYVLLGAVISLPIDYGRHYLLPKSQGWLGDETPLQWLAGQLLGLLPWLVAAMLLLWIPYALMRRSPRRWWLWAALAVIPVTLFFLVVQPVWIKPLTATYQPLAAGPLRASIDALAARCGLDHVPVVVGGSDTAVYGLGPSARIFLQSDLAATETAPQIRFTVAHELKHYLLADNWKLVPMAVGLALVGFWLTYRLGGLATRRWSRRMGFAQLDDPASLPLLVLCISLLWLAVTPAFLAYNRSIEREADRFGLELSHENEAAAQLFASWAAQGSDWVQPDRFALAFFYTHPSIAQRLRMANDYHPWRDGQPLRYAGFCDRQARRGGAP